jgi:hypothetical protein
MWQLKMSDCINETLDMWQLKMSDCINETPHTWKEDYGKRPRVEPPVTNSKKRNPTRRTGDCDVSQIEYDLYICVQCGLFLYTVTGTPIGGGKVQFKNGLFFVKNADGLFVEKNADKKDADKKDADT